MTTYIMYNAQNNAHTHIYIHTVLYTYQPSRKILIHVLLQGTILGNIMFIKTPSGTQQLKKKIILARLVVASYL